MTGFKHGHLADYFAGVVVKKLSAVEAKPASSNQHEFNGTESLRQLLGDDDRTKIPARFIWLGDEQEGIAAEGFISWYDARRRHPKRTEYRLYYPSNPVTEMMVEGDTLFVSIMKSGEALVIVAPGESSIQNQLLWLFGIGGQPGLEFAGRNLAADRADIDFAAMFILDELGIDPVEAAENSLDELIDPFGDKFPSTRNFSGLARRSLEGIDARDDPDLALLSWIRREEALFLRLERRVVGSQIKKGFLDASGEVDMPAFMKFSLGVHNRRKARAGLALEHHLEAVFAENGLQFSRGTVTERRNKPDFLFPGIAEYRAPAFPADRLTMLGSKSTLKDRWRQVLPEADRITAKHLATLQPGISLSQTDQMAEMGVHLVIPKAIHATFRDAQRLQIMSIANFIALVRKRQH